MSAPRILAIETSCDETGVAVVTGGRRIEANQVATQIALHAETGGIVPEVAARQQLRWMVPTLRAAMDEAEVNWSDLDAVAVTPHPVLLADGPGAEPEVVNLPPDDFVPAAEEYAAGDAYLELA